MRSSFLPKSQPKLQRFLPERLSSPVKIKKYFKKRKLNIEYQSSFLFNILLQKIHSDFKMLYNFVIIDMYKILNKKKYIFFQ